ncbi:YdcF family protein [Romeria aff. gracilis LEGE 07310]|uniref:YdcF family protein n=1 Tax=Vasconcelosia minhoensis LEGE 07310 TaxID=915328 RepID=A0A8J7A989_9CYAN|nr:YdcF family protein [Romeria gracilis]MBE9078445.1 YdcF family protein [Romeria aff. gracilis LEGE 07310]
MIQTNKSAIAPTHRRAHWGLRLGLLALAAPLVWFTYGQSRLSQPHVALVLGGAPEREQFAAEFAKAHPNVEIWISSGSNPEYTEWIFNQAQIPTSQWRLDYSAVDTVTNFTTLIDELKAEQVEAVYLITSDYHMRRASVVARIVLGSQGIYFKPVAVPTQAAPNRPETLVREFRDGARSLLWVFTGKTGSELGQRLSKG